MKKIPLGTKIIVTTAGLVAVAGIFYAANPQPFATIRAPMSDREIAPAEPAANPTPFGSPIPMPIGVAASKTDVIATEYCSLRIDKINCFGNVSKLGTLPQGTGCGEKYITIAPGQAAMAGFTPRDIFIASGPNIYRLRPPNQTATLFATLSSNTTDHTGITFDHVGTFGYNLIVTTENGVVWKIDATGNPTSIAHTGTELE